MTTLIYKIATRDAWEEARPLGHYEGSADDHRDGFIHFSTHEQLAGTLAKHFAGQQGLLLVAVDPERLSDKLRWEPSRGGELFPHLYAPLSLEAVIGVADLPLNAQGGHDLAGALQRLDETEKAAQSPSEAREEALDEGGLDQGARDQASLDEGLDQGARKAARGLPR